MVAKAITESRIAIISADSKYLGSLSFNGILADKKIFFNCSLAIVQSLVFLLFLHLTIYLDNLNVLTNFL